MALTLLMTIASALVALALFVCGALLKRATPYQWVGYGAWGGLVASFGLISAELIHGGAALLLSASFAASCVTSTLPVDAWRAIRRASVVAIAVSVCAVLLASNSYYEPPTVDANILLFAGQWSTIAAALALALGAVTFDRQGGALLDGAMIAVALIAALFMGTTRYALPDFVYAVELSSADRHVRWALPAVTPGSSLFGFKITQVIPHMVWLLGLGAVCGIAGALWRALDERRRIAGGLFVASGVSAASSLALILYHGFHAKIPALAPYAKHARDIGIEQGVPEGVLAMGRLDVGETIYVLWLDVLGDIGLLGGAAWLALASAAALFGERGDEPALLWDSRAHAHLCDFALYAAGLTWIGWVLSALLNWRIHAVYGVGSATEWSMLGAALLATGGAVMVRSEGRAAQRIGALIALLSPALLIAYALIFDVPPGVILR